MPKRRDDIQDPHLLGEIALIKGEDASLAILANYFRQQQNPSPNILKTLSRYLDGDGDDEWVMRFTPRTGRPPTRAAGAEIHLSQSLFSMAEDCINGKDVHSHREVLLMLAENLDPEGQGKWKLVYSRPREGNPSTKLQNELKKARFGLRAQQLYAKFGNLREADDQLRAEAYMGFDERSRKRAVQFVNRTNKDKPTK